MANPKSTGEADREMRQDGGISGEQTETIDIEALAQEYAATDAAGDVAEGEAPLDIGEYATDVETEMNALRAERDEMRDRWMRALAEAENARKRGERDRREGEQYGGSKLSRDLLPVYDNLKRALDAASEEATDKALIEGVELTMRELVNIFAKHAITKITPERGEKFDPQMHQAMFEAPVPGTRAGEIIEVMTEGFMLHDRLLRPAQVGVSSTPAG